MHVLKLTLAELKNQMQADELRRKLVGSHGIVRVDVNVAKHLVRVIGTESIDASWIGVEPAASVDVCTIASARPSFLHLAGLFALAIALGFLFSKFGGWNPGASLGVSLGFGAVFLLGLLAASSSCIAVSGGLLLSSVAVFNRRYGREGFGGRMRPVALFVVGRLLSYAVFGGVIGWIGQALLLSPAVLGLITIVAALYMITMGLSMLQMTPLWLKRVMPTMPVSVARKIFGAKGNEGPVMPFLLGAATFFLPCGFTQALQLYALTTGSAFVGAMLLFAFALGTVPSLLALGWASSSLKGKVGQFFFHFSGAVVILLGLTNIQNGLTIAGHPLTLPKFTVTQTIASIDPNVTMIGNQQSISMSILSEAPYYSPSSEYTVQVGVPVKMTIAGEGAGCRSVFQIPGVGVQKTLTDPTNVVEFTPKDTGDLVFSCSMGMYRGTIHVVSG